MFLEKVKTEGLAHLSYVVGDGGQAAVIDPRRDVGIYLDIARRHDCTIEYIFETHRNEDYIIGSVPLRELTNARICHGKQMDFAYGSPVDVGDLFEMGSVRLEVLHTPGHTYESISLALYDTAFSKRQAVGVFTGDALFIGDVGRTDFFPDKRRQVAELLYDSLFSTLLPLGDSVILYPAHGAGSVCGSGMANREFSTLGYERLNNPMLQKDRDEFIAWKAIEHHYQPPYFKKMEEVNRKGIGLFEPLPNPAPMAPSLFEEGIHRGMIVVDVRSPEAFAGAHIPGALSLPMNMLASFAGWFLSYDKPIGLVVEEGAQVREAVEHLFRIGYDNIMGYLARGMKAWQTSGRHFETVGVIDAASLKDRIDRREPFTLLDVRGIEEFNRGHLPGAKHIYVGELPRHLDALPREETITTFCGSGRRAMIAASILKAADFEHVEDCLGSMAACKAIGCPITV